MYHYKCTSYYNLFSQIPEYCKVMEESEVVENAFSLIFAFDEIVALGYRENVNLAQIRTFTEMDSHEEKVFRAVRQASVNFNVITIKLQHNINSEIIIICSTSQEDSDTHRFKKLQEIKRALVCQLSMTDSQFIVLNLHL